MGSPKIRDDILPLQKQKSHWLKSPNAIHQVNNNNNSTIHDITQHNITTLLTPSTPPQPATTGYDVTKSLTYLPPSKQKSYWLKSPNSIHQVNNNNNNTTWHNNTTSPPPPPQPTTTGYDVTKSLTSTAPISPTTARWLILTAKAAIYLKKSKLKIEPTKYYRNNSIHRKIICFCIDLRGS